jgi:hypothetical protein
MSRASRMSWRLSPFATVLLLLSGCAGPLEPRASIDAEPAEASVRIGEVDAPTDPSDPSGPNGAFYPLDLANHWSYARTFRFQIVPNSGPPSPPEEFLSTLDIDLIGHEERYGREYVVQRETYHEDDNVFSSSFLYRQDRGGLYNADPEPVTDLVARSSRRPSGPFANAAPIVAALRAVGAGPAYMRAVVRLLEKHQQIRQVALRAGVIADAARPGALPGEITMLSYPLHTGASWIVRESPIRVVNSVQASESLELPAGRFTGWRIRIDFPDLFGPDDRAQVWQSRSGLLQLRAHFVGEATDDQGNFIGRVISDETQELTSLSLTGPGAN